MNRREVKELMAKICETHKTEDSCSRSCACCPVNSISIKSISAVKLAMDSVSTK